MTVRSVGMKRSKIVTENKELVGRKAEDKLEPAEKEVNISYTPVEELVATSTENLKSMNVVNGKGERLGKIEDLMIDLRSGRIAYAVLSFGGFLGFGSKLFAIPWELLCIDNKWNYEDIYRQNIVFNIAREKLEKAPGFDKNEWPKEPDRSWLKDVFEYYGCRPYWAPPEEANRLQPPPP
jgi:sporulation protein YlmC with PRC-barrel domain